MRRPRASGITQSVHARLLQRARSEGRPLDELLSLYAVERFLHRLGPSSYRDQFAVKGAFLLRQWLRQDSRPTRDLDLLGPSNLDAEGIRERLVEILQVKVESDGVEYDVGSLMVRPIRPESPVLGFRAKFDAN